MRDCELCQCPANMHCESDKASLCWDCDGKVHSANFLVARHSRNLLCNICQSPTPWRASGAKLSPTISVCGRCPGRCGGPTMGQDRRPQREEEEGNDQVENDGYLNELSEDESEEGDDDEEDPEMEEEGDNQVVPWSLTPPLIQSSSCSETSETLARTASAEAADFALKRTRESADLRPQDDLGRSSSSPSERQLLLPWKRTRCM